MVAAPAWVRVLGAGLPARVSLDSGGDAGPLRGALAGALFALVNSVEPSELEALSALLLQDPYLQRDATLRVWLRRNPSGAGRVAGLLGRMLVARLAEGIPIQEGLDEALGTHAVAAAVRDAFDAWEGARRALVALSEALSYSQPLPSAPLALPARDLWLGWAQGLSRSGNSGGRPHHLHRFLVLVTGDAARVRKVKDLQERLMARAQPPDDWGEILRRLLTRAGWHEEGADELRGVPLATALATWGRLTRAPTDQPYQAALMGFADDLAVASRRAWIQGLPPPVLFGPRVSTPSALQPIQDPPPGASALWISDLLRRDGDLRLELAPGEAAAASVAHALHVSADNQAASWMPSLLLWSRFWAVIGPWCQANARVLRGQPRAVEPRDALELDGASQWVLHRTDGLPWSASRLLDALTLRLVEPERGLGPLRGDHFLSHDPEARALVPSLLERIDHFLAEAEQSAELRRARSREPRLRWRGPDAALDSALRGAVELAPRTVSCLDCARLNRHWAQLHDGSSDGNSEAEDAVQELFRVLHLHYHREPGPAATGARASLLREARHFIDAHLAAAERVWSGGSDVEQELASLERGLQQALFSLERPVAAPRPHSPGCEGPRLKVHLRVSAAQVDIHVEGRPGLASISARFPPDDFRLSWALTEAAARLHRPGVDPALPRLLGDALSSLLPRPAWTVLHDALFQADPGEVALQLRLERPWDALPWELLRDDGSPGLYLGLKPRLAITRVLPCSALRDAVAAPAEPRLLFVSAGLPDDVIDAELEAAQGYAAVVAVRGADRSALASALRASSYTGLHLACHAEPGHVILADGPISAEDFAALVAGRVARFCVLQVCWGASALPSALPGFNWTGLAGRLLESGIPDVLGLASTLRNDEAAVMAWALFQALKDGANFACAAADARVALHRAQPQRGAFGLLQHFGHGGARC